MRKKIVAAAVLSVLLGAGFAAAHDRRPDPEKRAERLVSRVARELSLDAGQREQFGKLVADFQPVVRQLRAGREETREKLGAQLKAGAIDAGSLTAAVHANLEQVQRSADAFIERLAAFHATLTPAQKAKVARKFEKFAGWRDAEREGGRRHKHHRDRR